MTWLVDNWYMIIVGLVVLGVIIVRVINFFKLSNEEKLKKIKGWLVWAVTEAETTYGSGTGEVKLPFVYDLFVGKFAWLAKIIPYEVFKNLVDEALKIARKIWEDKPEVLEIEE